MLTLNQKLAYRAAKQWTKSINNIKKKEKFIISSLAYDCSLFLKVFASKLNKDTKNGIYKRIFRDIKYNIGCADNNTLATEDGERFKQIYRDLLNQFENNDRFKIKADRHNRSYVVSHTSDEVSFDGIDLGTFTIKIFFSNIKNGLSKQSISVKPNMPNPASNSDIYHPHISGDVVCWGDAEEPMIEAIIDGRIDDIIDLFESFIHTYNPSSAYSKMEDWYGGKVCQSCDNTINTDEEQYCDGCQNPFCCDCCSYCDRCSETYCSECSNFVSCRICTDGSICESCGKQEFVECQDCEENCHGECATICICENIVCKNCARNNEMSCATCGDSSYCSECTNHCQKCLNHLCSNCVDKCDNKELLCQACEEENNISIC